MINKDNSERNSVTANKVSKGFIFKVVSISIISFIMLLLLSWTIAICVYKNNLKSAAKGYFEALINTEYIENENKLEIAINKENEREITRSVVGTEDLEDSVVSMYGLNIDTEKFVGITDYINSYAVKDRERLNSLKASYEALGNTNGIDYRNILKALESLDNLSVEYVETLIDDYVTKVLAVAYFECGFEAIDEMCEEYKVFNDYDIEYNIDNSILELRETVNDVVKDSAKGDILEYCDKVHRLIDYYGMDINSKNILEPLNTFMSNDENYSFTVQEYQLASKYESIEAGINVIATSENNELDEKYIELQNEYNSFIDSSFTRLFGILDVTEMANKLVNETFEEVIEVNNISFPKIDNNIVNNNLKNAWQVNIILGGMFDEIDSKRGICLYDNRLNIAYNVVMQEVKADELNESDIGNINLWANANKLLFAEVYARALDEENTIDEDMQEKYYCLYSAMQEVMRNAYNNMEIY